MTRKEMVSKSQCDVNSKVYYIDTYRHLVKRYGQVSLARKVKTDRERVAEVQKKQLPKPR